MTTTSLSLLDRLQGPRTPAAWEQFHSVYRPLIAVWLGRVPGLGTDADDLAQNVLVVVMQKVTAFEHRGKGSFRAWLKSITINQVRAHWRSQNRRPVPAGNFDSGSEFLAQLEDPGSDLSKQWDREHDRAVFDKLLATVRPDFEPQTWEAFLRTSLREEPASRVAVALGISEAAVLSAKARVLRRLRQEAAGLID